MKNLASVCTSVLSHYLKALPSALSTAAAAVYHYTFIGELLNRKEWRER